MLVVEIAALFKEGFRADDDIMHYIDSTFFNPSISEIKAILSDENNCERDSLLDLLIYPDEQIQKRLEPLIKNQSFTHSDIRKILTGILDGQDHLPSTIRFSNGNTAYLFLPDYCIERFLDRLHLSHPIDPAVYRDIDDHVPEDLKCLTKVKVRNANARFDENRALFIRRFFQDADLNEKDYFDCLDFLLQFLKDIDADDNIFEQLMAVKQYYAENLEKADEFETRHQGKNMETLVLQGVKIPFIDKADTLRRLSLIDNLSRITFGKTGYFYRHRPDTVVSFDSDPSQIEKLIRQLM